MSIKKLLGEIENILKANNAYVLPFLNEGLTGDSLMISLNTNRFDFEIFPETLKEFYTWHNGTKVSYDVPANNYNVFGGYFLASIEYMAKTIEADTVFGLSYNKYIPVFSNGHGEHLLVNELKEGIYYCGTWNFELPPYPRIYDSIETMLQTIIECYKQGAYFFTNEGGFDVNIELEHELSANMNPHSEYWTLL